MKIKSKVDSKRSNTMLLVPSMNSVIQHNIFPFTFCPRETWSWAIVSLDGFPLGNIFARQQSIVGPISNGKEACVVVFLQYCSFWSTVHSIVLVLRQVGKPHYFYLCRVDHHVYVVPHVPPSHREFILRKEMKATLVLSTLSFTSRPKRPSQRDPTEY